ncbi:MAG: DUF1810 domain-containing protein [Burkholderiaceae bacterium]
MSTSAHGLERFIEAQESVYETVRADLTAGKKRRHWMWFIFPQLKGLGRSDTARFFGIDGRDEAVAYWRHPVLGARLKACTQLVARHEEKTAFEILGSPDDVKLKSCMTLFAVVAPGEAVFSEVLQRYFEGERDVATLDLLG